MGTWKRRAKNFGSKRKGPGETFSPKAGEPSIGSKRTVKDRM